MQSQNTTLDDLATVIGFTATLKLAAWFGSVTSQNLYVPGSVVEDHTLAKLIGLAAFRRLVEEFGNEHIAVPMGSVYSREVRNRHIRDDFMTGMSEAMVAERHRLTVRRTQQLKREFETAGLLPVGDGL